MHHRRSVCQAASRKLCETTITMKAHLS